MSRAIDQNCDDVHITRVVALIAVQVREQRQSVTACAHAQFSAKGKIPKEALYIAADEFVKHIGAAPILSCHRFCKRLIDDTL